MAEIFAVTAVVSEVICDSCGDLAAATSSDTSELTSITEPPAAELLELLAIDTIGADEVLLLVLLVVILSNP